MSIKETSIELLSRLNKWMVVTFLLAVITSTLVNVIVINSQLDPYTSYNPTATERYDVSVNVQVKFLNGTTSFYGVEEELDKYLIYNNLTERVLRQDYYFFTDHLNLSHTSFTEINLVITIPSDAYAKFRLIEGDWQIEEHTGSFSKATSSFISSVELANRLVCYIDITNIMYKEIPPNTIAVSVSFFNRD